MRSCSEKRFRFIGFKNVIQSERGHFGSFGVVKLSQNHPVYFQLQFICRVLVANVFLESLFDTEEDSAGLECDTEQVGCELNCINRFTPLNHTRIWEAELFMVVFTNLSFSAFRVFNEYQYNKFREDRNAEIGESEEKVPILNEHMKNCHVAWHLRALIPGAYREIEKKSIFRVGIDA